MRTDSNQKESPGTIIHEIRNYFQFLSTMGCRGFDCSAETIEMIQDWGKSKTLYSETIESIEKIAKDCHNCQLSNSRRQIVFGSGDPRARLMFVGGYPDSLDEKHGLPFAGEAGGLLTKIIHAMGFTTEAVYLCNAVKCRPPETREPLQEEVNACRSLLHQQIQIVQPDIICTLGSVSTHALLNTTKPLSSLRGQFHKYGRINIMPTYHPSLLLNDTSKKRDVWEDMKLVMLAFQKRASETK